LETSWLLVGIGFQNGHHFLVEADLFEADFLHCGWSGYEAVFCS
jgi:hypothetical protein